MNETVQDSTRAFVREGRLELKHLSGGISSDAVYSRIERLIELRGLQGSVLNYGAGLGNLTRRPLAFETFGHIAAVVAMSAPPDPNGSVEWREPDLNISLQGCDEKSPPQFYFMNEGGVPACPIVTWQKVKLGLLRGVRFSDNLLAVATKSGGRD